MFTERVNRQLLRSSSSLVIKKNIWVSPGLCHPSGLARLGHQGERARNGWVRLAMASTPPSVPFCHTSGGQTLTPGLRGPRLQSAWQWPLNTVSTCWGSGDKVRVLEGGYVASGAEAGGVTWNRGTPNPDLICLFYLRGLGHACCFGGNFLFYAPAH